MLSRAGKMSVFLIIGRFHRKYEGFSIGKNVANRALATKKCTLPTNLCEKSTFMPLSSKKRTKTSHLGNMATEKCILPTDLCEKSTYRPLFTHFLEENGDFLRIRCVPGCPWTSPGIKMLKEAIIALRIDPIWQLAKT